jgi:hypothetical protein
MILLLGYTHLCGLPSRPLELKFFLKSFMLRMNRGEK